MIGHEAAKQRLRDDAALLARGALDCVPMGYLLCGPVGTGKSFMAMCAAGEIGIPCVMLKNFRSKYVGETEGNLERVLSVLRAMGPVMVIVDEADAALGDRDTEGDSGTSSRVFGMIATQMGDTRYRGRILWMLLTARPDLLPIDIKRQGRAEVHIPLFYPTEDEELQQMFVVLAQEARHEAAPEDVPPVPAAQGNALGRGHRRDRGPRAGASRCSAARSMSRARRSREVARRSSCRRRKGWRRSCRRRRRSSSAPTASFFPPAIVAEMEKAGGRAALQERLTALKELVAQL